MQTKLQSLLEALWNTFIGYLISVGVQVWLLPMCGVHLPLAHNMQIVAIFTAISILRSFVVRRFFNHRHRPLE